MEGAPAERTYLLKQMPEDFIVTEEPPRGLCDAGEYLVFCMQKKNYTTENAVQQVARSLKINRKAIGYAGSKDSRAITYQSISIRGATAGTAECLGLKDISLEFLGYRKEPISLGDLDGNLFEITARGIDSLPQKKSRMVNYFGEQRFSSNNAEVGKAIIRKDFKSAASLLCSGSDIDRDAIEGHLATAPGDYVGALKRIPWKILTLYIHAYQSLLWNKCASEYLRQYPSSANISIPLVGFATEFDQTETEEIYSQILSAEGIRQHDFIIRAIPDLSSAGSSRNLFEKIEDLDIGPLEDDELNPGRKKCVLKFRLGKGSYATEAVKSLFTLE